MKVCFLDRDGTINIDHGWVSTVDRWEWAPGALEALQMIQNAGYALIIVTNQSGIAMGYYTEEEVETLHQFMVREAAKADVYFFAVLHCPHARDAGCDCRKPAVGMARGIEKILDIDYAESWMIGDKPTDVKFGNTLGMKTALIRSDYWESLDCEPTIVVDNLLGIAKFL